VSAFHFIFLEERFTFSDVGPMAIVQEEKAKLCFSSECCALFTRPANTLLKKYFKTGSYNTIHIFTNYFVIVFSVFNNKRYPNRPLYSKKRFA